MPRGSLRCLRKKYSSHQLLEARVQCRRRRARARRGRCGGSGARRPRSRSTASGPCRRRTSTRVAPSAGSAANMRTFMCTVGTYGLRGWKHQRHAHRLERRAGQLGRGARGRRRQRLARARARSCSRRARSARRLRSAARCRSPCEPARRARVCQASRAKRVAVGGFERGDDALLQVEQVRAATVHAGERPSMRVVRHDCVQIARVTARWPMSRRYCAPSKWMPRSDVVGAAAGPASPSRRAR